MKESFDHIVQGYDTSFTNTRVGRIQRNLVYRQLRKLVGDFDGLNVLEINCGTGEDARWMADQGANVLATDISPEMVAETKRKCGDGVRTEIADMREVSQWVGEEKFDLIFSNFGGVNCLSYTDLEKALNDLSKQLSPGGKLILVVMPRFCWNETAYFMTKGKWSEAFRRRKRSGVGANVEGEKVWTWYFSPRDIRRMLKGLIYKRQALVGFFTPPSYLDSYFKDRPRSLKRMETLDRKLQSIAFLAGSSDHYLICFQK